MGREVRPVAWNRRRGRHTQNLNQGGAWTLRIAL
jgi:hypothetical protein